MAVPGVQDVIIISFSRDIKIWFLLSLAERIIEQGPGRNELRPLHGRCREGIRYNPGEDGFFQLSAEKLTIDTEVS